MELLKAADAGDEEKVNALLAKGANVNATNKQGRTALMCATSGNAPGAPGVAKLLLEHKANVEAKTQDGTTALIFAAQYNAVGVATLLLEHKANVNAKTQAGFTALIVAAQNNAVGVATLLLEHKADMEKKLQGGFTALHLAAQTNAAGVAKLLLEHEANVEAKDQDGFTPLDFAKHFRAAIVLRLLPGGKEYIMEQGKRELAAFMSASLVLVLSTRFNYPLGYDVRNCCDPKKAATIVKKKLQLVKGVMVFDPNADNAYIMEGDSAEANSIWLKNWRKMLKKAKETNGAVVQILVNGGPSHMQDEEEDMAKDKGVPVIKLDAAALRGQLVPEIGVWNGVDQPKEVAKLEALADKVLPALEAGVKKVSKDVPGQVDTYEEVVFEA